MDGKGVQYTSKWRLRNNLDNQVWGENVREHQPASFKANFAFASWGIRREPLNHGIEKSFRPTPCSISVG